MQEMPYYYAEDKGWKKYTEALIPVIILVIIAIVLVGKSTTLLCNVPVLGPMFCAKGDVKIGLIGDFSDKAKTSIDANLFKQIIDAQGAAYQIYTVPIDQNILKFPREKLLGKFDIVIVAGMQNLTYEARDALGIWVQNGGKVIVIGDAGTRDPDDVLIRGWSSAAFGDVFPVALAISGPVSGIPTKIVDNAVLNFIGEHPILHDYARLYQLNLTEVNKASCSKITAVNVVPEAGADQIAWLMNSQDSAKFALAVLEKGTLWGGKILYFNYDPGCTRGIAIASIRYLAGR